VPGGPASKPEGWTGTQRSHFRSLEVHLVCVRGRCVCNGFCGWVRGGGPRAAGCPGLGLGAGWGELFCVGEEVGGAGVERLGDFEDVCEAGVAVSALDAADVGAVEVAEFGEGFLGEADFFAGVADGVAECGVVGGADGHWRSLPSHGLLVYGL
jgi:hypothetical protein